MTGMELDRMVIGVFCLCISLGLGTLFAIYWSMPSPRRAVAPAPVDRPGYTYTCYCYRDSMRVKILADETPRGRHARTESKSARRRSRSVSSPNAGAAGGRGEHVPVSVAA